jgi:hypothetical protein
MLYGHWMQVWFNFKENSASEHDTTPSHKWAYVNDIYSVNMIYAHAVNCLCCMNIEYVPDPIFRLGKSISASEYNTTTSEYDLLTIVWANEIAAIFRSYNNVN